MASNLVIVESPAKAKTIEGFLGKDYIVRSSFGHVMDLNKTQISVDTENDFEPKYEISPEKKKLVGELKKMAKAADMVWLASDEDREGEAISWHLFNALGLKEDKTKRIVFHEITKDAIMHAIQNPRGIDKNLVSAQQARRVLDRLVGYELSPLLWKKVKPSLSAGRVQSVAVRLIVEREEEIKNFISETYFRITAEFKIDHPDENQVFTAELPIRLKTHDEAKKFLEKQIGAKFTVESVEKKPGKKSPSAPFTTSTLQQEAARKLGYSVANTMRIAQHLYEAGHITYMRTDSLNLSNTAIGMAKAEITGQYGEKYLKIRKYTTKTKGAQEAHEAIRPTYFSHQAAGKTNEEKRLYDLIWKRAIASQMSDAQIEKTNVVISSSGDKTNFVATGEVITFDGFLKVYLESTDDENSEQAGLLPAMKTGEKLDLLEMKAKEGFTKHPPRYNEASLVKKLEDLGIGRPSTYAPTLSTIQQREYVVKEARPSKKQDVEVFTLKKGKITSKHLAENISSESSKLYPTDIGTLVNSFLVKFFENIVDYNFTANAEKEFDEIAEGQKEWNHMIKEFYGPFHKQIADTQDNSGKFSGEKLLGKDPESGKNVFVKIGRFGPLAQIGETDSEEKPKFAGLHKTQSIETITLQEALKLFDFPRTVGIYNDEEVKVAIGRFGPYIAYNKKFFSLKKEDNPATIEIDRAIEIILEKQEKDRLAVIKTFKEDEEVKLLNGRYGPYLVIGKQNYKLPKNTDPAALSLEECYAISKDPNNLPKKRVFKKKK